MVFLRSKELELKTHTQHLFGDGGPAEAIAVTAVINIVEGGRRSLFTRSTLPPLISDTLVTGMAEAST